MKALSIIGIVLSVLGLALSLDSMNGGSDAAGVCFVLFLYFLAFAITATAVSFRKRKAEFKD